MLSTKLSSNSQLFWYIDIAYENENEHENENPYDSGTLPSNIYSGKGSGTLGKLYHYTTGEVHGLRRQWCSLNLWILCSRLAALLPLYAKNGMQVDTAIHSP